MHSNGWRTSALRFPPASTTTSKPARRPARPTRPSLATPVSPRTENRVIASAHDSLKAACTFFEQHGIPAVVLSDSVSGDAQAVAQQHAALARACKSQSPLALISGGETTVTLSPQHGRGGRNTEYLLALALALQDTPGVGHRVRYGWH